MQYFTRREGYSPSYRQIGERLGIAVSTVSYHVALLKADGSLHREPVQPRTITWPGRPSAAAEGGGAAAARSKRNNSTTSSLSAAGTDLPVASPLAHETPGRHNGAAPPATADPVNDHR